MLLFARLRLGQVDNTCCSPDVVRQIVQAVIQESEELQQETTDELFRLGAVWSLDTHKTDDESLSSKQQREKKKAAWQRAVMTDDYQPTNNWAKFTLRVHCRPARFPCAKDWKVSDAIVVCEESWGFCVLNKPCGLPAHATVDNGSENALALFQKQRCNTVCSYASLPQRLDTESSGLLMVATQKEFASHMCKLLQNKTERATTNSILLQDATADAAAKITKHYCCLVDISNLEQHEILLNQTVITHYLDAQSPAPKRFVSQIPSSSKEENTTTTTNKWLECQLRLVRVGDPFDGSLLRNSVLASSATTRCVAQIEVELLTGRTHQIRGQLAALGCPIVGDPLYGTSVMSVTEQRQTPTKHHMALQCCAMEFPQPEWQDKKLVPSTTKKVSLKLDTAWWT